MGEAPWHSTRLIASVWWVAAMITKGCESHLFVAVRAWKLKSSLPVQDFKEGFSQAHKVGCAVVRGALGGIMGAKTRRAEHAGRLGGTTPKRI